MKEGFILNIVGLKHTTAEKDLEFVKDFIVANFKSLENVGIGFSSYSIDSFQTILNWELFDRVRFIEFGTKK